MTISLVADSTVDLPPWLAQTGAVTFIPMNIQFELTSFKEGAEIGPPEFYRKITEGLVPQSSQPALGDFVATYTSMSAQTDEIISIHISQKLSGTFQTARLAASMVADKVKVHVIDSAASTAATGWMCDEIVTMIERGCSAEEIRATIEPKREKTTVFFGIENLKFAQQSGRVGRLAGLIGAMLNIKPIIGLKDGRIEVTEKVHSRKNIQQRVVDLTVARVQDAPVNVCAVHTQSPEQAQSLLALASQRLNVQKAFTGEVSIAVAVHFGPGVAGLITYPAF